VIHQPVLFAHLVLIGLAGTTFSMRYVVVGRPELKKDSRTVLEVDRPVVVGFATVTSTYHDKALSCVRGTTFSLHK
jgi:hypothetical protein